jgi:hypothetical protein
MSSVASAVCTASAFTSAATTAKPLPASPARTASIVALSARRLVCPAMARISLTTSPVFCAACASVAISRLVPWASSTAARAMSAVRASCRPISPIELASSSEAIAAVSPFSEASFDADTAPSALRAVLPELPSSTAAVVRIAMAPSATVWRCSSTRWRKARIACATAARRSSCSRMARRSRSAPRRSVTSSCVATQPPPGIGRLMMQITRPSPEIVSGGLLLRQRRPELAAIVFDVDRQALAGAPVFEQRGQGTPGFATSGGSCKHRDSADCSGRAARCGRTCTALPACCRWRRACAGCGGAVCAPA